MTVDPATARAPRHRPGPRVLLLGGCAAAFDADPDRYAAAAARTASAEGTA